MSNNSGGLISSGGLGGWDTTPIQNNNNNNNNNNILNDPLFEDNNNNNNNNNGKLKPYKNQIASNPFMNGDTNKQEYEEDNNYINPFSFDFGIDNTNTNANNSNNNNNNNNNNTINTMKPINETKQVSEVFDMLFETNNNNNNNNNNNINNKNSNNNNNTNDDAFYSFDFGINDNKIKKEEKETSSEQENDKNEREESSTSSTSSTSSSSSSQSSQQSSSQSSQQNKNKNNLKISPPTKQSTRKKKRRNSSQQNSKNKKTFESLHNKFDPSLINTSNDGTVNTKAKKKRERKKRNTEPPNIHSERQKQLQKEGIISDNNNKKDNNKKDNKKQSREYNVLPELHRGTALLKYGRRGYPHFRQFNLTSDNENLRWFSSKKKLKQSSINVGSINEILTGQHTKEFRRIAWTTLTPASFSIIYENKKKSLNLVAKSVDEMKMWVQSLRKLRDLKKKGENLSIMEKLSVEVDFRDRNRPQSRNHSGNFLRSHETKERSVDPILQRKLIDDIGILRKQFIEISREANNPIVQSTKEYESIEQILSELEERIEELDHEIRNTRNTKIAENDVWRTRIDLESLREKIKVINKQHKSEYKNSKRRWSVF